ncbi:MAG: thioredoxin family protein [Desulfobacterales bacterium]
MAILWAAFLWLAALSNPPPAVAAAAAEEAAEPVRLAVSWPLDPLPARGEAALAVALEIAPGFHVMADRAAWGERTDFRPFPTRLELREAPAGVIAEAPLYPPARPLAAGFTDRPLPTFEGRAVILLPLRLDLPPETRSVRLGLAIAFQACTESACLLPEEREIEAVGGVAAPGEATRVVDPALTAELDARRPPPPAAGEAAFQLFGVGVRLDGRTAAGAAGILLLGALGGVLLNFTPCVLPLIPVKIISLSRAAADPRRCRRLGLLLTAGIVSFWLGLGLAVATASGIASAHGLFQIPAFSLAVGIVLAALAAGTLRGWSPHLPGFLYRFEPRLDSPAGAFGIGILTGVLSTPCTAPFMGTAAAWAAARSPEAAVIVFSAIGLGMGAPYALLAAFPHRVGGLRAAGPASELVKQAMALLLLAAAFYFAGIGAEALFPGVLPPHAPGLAVRVCIAASGLWVALRGPRLAVRRSSRLLWAAIGLLIAAGTVTAGLRLSAPAPFAWEPFDAERLARARADGRAVVLVFTADWCLNCRALEEGVWKRPEILRRLAAPEVAAFKADLTAGDPEGKRMLQEVGSLTVPLLVVYGRNGRLLWKGDFYTAGQLAAILDRALASP